MKKYNLAFISDKDLFHHVADTVSQYRFEIDLKKLACFRLCLKST